ncbi:MAG TPA: acyl-CoA dehydrogenase family protein, partial [Burkholderiaceae bacterium]
MSAESLIEQSAQRLFSEQVDKAARERVEDGTFDDRLWQLAVDNGLTFALASEAAGGVGATWSVAAPILHAIGYHQVPLPLAETMVGALLLSLAGIDLPDGPIALIEQGCGNTLHASGSGAALRIDGSAAHVAWARHASTALLSLGRQGLALVDLRQPSVTCDPGLDPARMPSDTVV